MNNFPKLQLLRGNVRLLIFLVVTGVFFVPDLIFKTAKVISASMVTGPMPQAQANFVRIIPLTANDVVYSPVTKMLYASLPSSAGASGNSIATIDPLTGSINSSAFIGSEPNKMALAGDGITLYTSLDGAYSIRRFDVSTQTPGPQFPLGQDSFFGLYRVGDLAVAPGNSNLVAVARQYGGVSPPEAGVAVFDNGVQRPTTAPGHVSGSDYLAFSAIATKLYGTGFYSGLTTLKIDANGVSITGTSTVGQGSRIKFDNGVVYAANGQVIDPDVSNGTLKGTFSGANSIAFVPDSSAGRAYFLEQSSSSSRTLRAFDINTFLQIGSFTVSGLNGDVTNMIRWGSNGLAFRTTGNQLVIIQTSLIPSADPIPTPTSTPSPTPSPSPTPPATFVRQISLNTNDLIYNVSKQSLYASIPSSAGAIGNSIAPIDPVAATVGTSVFVGSEPNKLAQSDDFQTMYVSLSGAGSVRRFDLNTQTAGLQFYLGNDPFDGPRNANDVAVMPGAPGTVAVSRSNSSTAIYDDGVQRPQTQNPGSLAFRSSTTLYATNGSTLNKLSVAASGLSLVSSMATGSNGNIVYDNGLVYLSGGGVVDPEVGAIKGTFTGVGFGGSMAVDAANGKVFFLSNPASGWVLRAFDINTFLPLGSVTIQGLSGTPTSLVRWGSNGLAFRTPNQIFLIQSALVNPADPVPAATPTPSPTPSPSPPYIPSFVRKIDLQANDLVYNQSTQRLYASVPSFQGGNGNSITTIDPQSLAVGPSIFVGSEPNKLALADDNQTLYVNLDGASAVRQFDIPTQTAGLQFGYSISGGPADIDVMPGSPQTVALSLGINNLNNGVAIYDNGVKRPNTGPGSYYAVGPIEFNGNSTIYGFDSYTTGNELVKFGVSASGVAPVTITRSLINNASVSGFKFANGLLYSSNGRVVDPEAQKLVGTFQGTGFGTAIAVDASLGRIFYLSGGGSNVVLSAYDLNTFLPLGSVTLLTNVGGFPSGLVRWGSNGLAFRVTQNLGVGSSTNPSAVYLVQSALVSNASPIPTGVSLTSSTLNTFEGSGSLTVTVSRSGDVSSTTTVDYATSDGTATAGSDYTAASGTLTFTPGQLSKTFTVPIINDTLYEAGNETFNITLSNATGGAVLTSPSTAVVTISDNDPQPSIQMASTFRATEGNSGTKVFSVPINLSNPSVQTVSVNYTTADNTAVAGTDYLATSGTLVFAPGTISGSINVTVNGDTAIEPDKSFLVKLSNPVNASSFLPVSQVTVTIANDDSSIQLSAANFSVGEGGKSQNINVTRSGDTSVASSVSYATSDGAGSQNCNVVNGIASSRCDYITSLGSLTFAAGQTSKTVTVLVIDDAYAEGDETFTINLSNPSVSTLGSTSTATITITDNDSVDGPNPSDTVSFFVRQHYLDFLNREPDQSGFDFWTNQITSCGGDVQCNEVRRIDVSASFFLSIEFQQTGYLVERFYKVAYGDATGTSTFGGQHQVSVPIVRANEFLTDTQRIGRGVVVLQPGWEQALLNNKLAYALEFTQTSRFMTAFPTTMSPDQFVDKLNQNAGNVLSPSERTAAINLFSGAGDSSNLNARAQAIRLVAEDQDLYNAEFNRAFVLAQYFGYLRRNPNDPQDTDYTGYDFWLTKLNQFNGNYINAEMVKAFLSSIEYRQRFGP